MTLAATIKRSEAEREDWRYTSLKALREIDFAAAPVAVLPARDAKKDISVGGAELVFVNGVLDIKASRIAGLPEGLVRGDAANGYDLLLAEQTCLVISPLHLRFVTTAQSVPSASASKLRLTLGASTRLTLIETHEAAAGAEIAAHTVETEITLEPQAKLVHGKLMLGGVHNVHLAQTRVSVGAGAFYDNVALIADGKLTRNEIEVALNGAMAQCELQGAMLLRGSSHGDTTIRVMHKAANTTSRQIYKTVLAEKARGVFQGKVKVSEGAQKSDAQQLSRALLLSDMAEMDAKPELEIYADDVKCSHGSTVGDLDEQAMFYLRTRGLSEVAARGLLIRAFIDALVEDINAPEIRAEITAQVGVWMHG